MDVDLDSRLRMTGPMPAVPQQVFPEGAWVELEFLDGESFTGIMALSKRHRQVYHLFFFFHPEKSRFFFGEVAPLPP